MTDDVDTVLDLTTHNVKVLGVVQEQLRKRVNVDFLRHLRKCRSHFGLFQTKIRDATYSCK